MIAVMVGPSRLPALAVHDASSVCVASGGVLELAYWLRSVEARALAACHEATVSSEAGSHAWHGSTTSGTAGPPPDCHSDGGLGTLSAVQRDAGLSQRTGRAAHW